MTLLPPAASFHKWLTIFASLFWLTACAGGGSGSSTPADLTPPPTPPASPPPTINYNTIEYRGNYGLDSISAISAYDEGLSGAGVTVAVVDTGIDKNNGDLTGNLNPASTNVVTNNAADLQDTDGHGSAVSSVIAAARNDIDTMGVAFNADLLAINAATSGGCGTNCSFYQSDIAAGIDYARTHGAKVVNLSMGGDGVGFTLQGAMQRAIDAGMIIVIAAGNGGDSQPSAFAQIANQPWTNGQIVIAGATDDVNNIATFSNQAGLSKNHYLVAPGKKILAPGLDGILYLWDGTSLATPHVVGALALLLEKFPNLSAHDAADILLTTATDLGASGVDVTYGYGLANIKRAIAPIGTTAVATRTKITTPTVNNGNLVTASAMRMAPAFGDALAGSPALTGVMILDQYRRSFRMDLTSHIERQGNGFSLYTLAEPGRETISRSMTPFQGTDLTFSADQHNAFAEIDTRYFANTDATRRHVRDLRFSVTQRLSPRLSLQAATNLTLDPALPGRLAGLFLTRTDDYQLTSGGIPSQGPDISLGMTRQLDRQTLLALTAAYSHVQEENYGLNASRSAATAKLTRQVGRNLQLSARLGVIDEKGAVLGALTGGALSFGSGATTTWAGADMVWHARPGLQFFGGWAYARTRVASAANSLFSDISPIESQSFRAGLVGNGLFATADRLGLILAAPLRVTAGDATLRQVSVRDYATETLHFTSSRAPLSPSGQERDIELSYNTPIGWGPGQGWYLQANLLHRISPNNIATAPAQTLVILRLTSGF